MYNIYYYTIFNGSETFKRAAALAVSWSALLCETLIDGGIAMSDIIEQMEATAKGIYDKGKDTMKQAVIDTFEMAIEEKPEISAKELYELMKKHEVL